MLEKTILKLIFLASYVYRLLILPCINQDENNTLTDGQNEPGIWNADTKK
jgi:hypothetical protein